MSDISDLWEDDEGDLDIQPFLTLFKKRHAKFSKAATILAEDEKPRRDTYDKAIVVTEGHNAAVLALMQPIIEVGTSTDDAGMLYALRAGMEQILRDVRKWEDSLYYSTTRADNDTPRVTKEQVYEFYRNAYSAFQQLLTFAEDGRLTAEEIKKLAPGEVDFRDTRGSDQSLRYLPNVGIPRNPKDAAAKTKKAGTSVTRLVVNGIVSSEMLGESLRRVGLTTDTFGKLLSDAKLSLSDPKKYTDDMVEYNGKKLGLRSA